MLTKLQFRQLFDKHAQSVASVLSYYVSEKTEVEDWVQEVFMKVWEKRDHIDPDHPGVKGYLLKMARNHALYKLKRTKDPFTSIESDIENIPSPGHSVLESLTRKELSRAYERALEQVPPRTREAFALSRDKGLTYNQIAVKMGISPKTVEHLISHALKILRVELHEFRV